jgi:hypothetical protein
MNNYAVMIIDQLIVLHWLACSVVLTAVNEMTRCPAADAQAAARQGLHNSLHVNNNIHPAAIICPDAMMFQCSCLCKLPDTVALIPLTLSH